MKKTFIKKMEEKLKEQQKKLREELSGFAKKSSRKEDDYDTNFPQYGEKEEENAAEVADFQDSLSLERNLEKTLAEVDQALEKIKKGNYGKCENCGKEIDEARLEAFPAALLCMDCKNEIVE